LGDFVEMESQVDNRVLEQHGRMRRQAEAGGAVIADVMKAQREFLAKMYGIAPNRLLLKPDDANALKDELCAMNRYQNVDDMVADGWFVNGMRIVEDPFANGIEVAYAR
jgi:hypothetical protein